MKAREAAPRGSGMSIRGSTTVAVLPLVLVGLVLAGILGWYLITADTTPGFSAAEATAGLVAVLSLLAIGQSLRVLNRRSGELSGQVRSISRDITRLASEDLPTLIGAIRNPDPSHTPIGPMEVDGGGPTEVAELTRSVARLHESLQEVAATQMETLKGGVSSLIVNLARRNAALVDRQLGLLDELEMREEDPKVLGTYYKVDHYATRIRRNAESLLVLAGEPPPRVWAKSMEMDDVIRAAVSEVDDYRRVEIVSVETAQLAGGVVADVSHLLAELLDNATTFSPSTEPVRVKSVFDWEGYHISITDRGPGMTNQEISKLNEILANPPPLGLVLEPTMGIYVISKLAARHGIGVELVPGIPGIDARVTIPRDLLEIKLRKPPTFKTVFKPTAKPEMVDLTDPELTGEGTLPVRTPSRGEQTAPQETVVEGDAPLEIRSALTAYNQGRRAAQHLADQEEEAS